MFLKLNVSSFWLKAPNLQNLQFCYILLRKQKLLLIKKTNQCFIIGSKQIKVAFSFFMMLLFLKSNVNNFLIFLMTLKVLWLSISMTFRASNCQIFLMFVHNLQNFYPEQPSRRQQALMLLEVYLMFSIIHSCRADTLVHEPICP